MCWTKNQKDSERVSVKFGRKGILQKSIDLLSLVSLGYLPSYPHNVLAKYLKVLIYLYAISMNFIVMNIYCGWIQSDLMKPDIEAKLIWTSTTMPWIAADTNWRQPPRLYLLYLYFTALVPIYCICTLERSYLLSRLRLKFSRRSSLRGTGIGWR